VYLITLAEMATAAGRLKHVYDWLLLKADKQTVRRTRICLLINILLCVHVNHVCSVHDLLVWITTCISGMHFMTWVLQHRTNQQTEIYNLQIYTIKTRSTCP